MFIRVVRFTGVTAASVDAVRSRIEGSGGPPPEMPIGRLQILFDESQGTAVVLQHFDSAEDMTAAAQVLGAMDASETPGTRASVDTCEVRFESPA
jgi:hypothetical protein